MASVSGLSSTSSIYGSRNVISGLASGMDTESMIENAVSGYKSKITSLNQKRTKVEWQQEAYRSIIDKMVAFNQKYTSYNSSSTNLLSAAFFNNAVNISTNGANASKIAATGRTTSDISILGVKHLASAARYSISAGRFSGDTNVITAESTFDLAGSEEVSTIDGSMTIKYGGNVSVSLKFGADEVFTDGADLADKINEKLAEKDISVGGNTYKASEKMEAKFVNGELVFEEKGTAGNGVTIAGLSGNMKAVLGDGLAEDKKSLAIGADIALSKTEFNYERLSGKSMSFTLDGITKTISLGTVDATTTPDALKETIQTELNKAFAGEKVTVGLEEGKLQFTVAEHSSLKISSSVNKLLGLGTGEVTSYMSTSKTLGSLVKDGKLDKSDWGALVNIKGTGDPIEQLDGTYLDKTGKKVDADGNRLNDDGSVMQGYEFKLNDVVIGTYTEDTALETIIADINKNTEAGVTASYSKTTNAFTFTSKETGGGREVKFGDGLAQSLFGGNIVGDEIRDSDGNKIGSYASGKDAVFTVEINGTEMEMTRSTNAVELDGLNVTLNGTFGYDDAGKLDRSNTEAVSFTTATDTEKILNVVKSMVEDYNAMMKEVKDAYSTLPAQKSNKTGYEPLTDEDRADMSESAIKAYEEKAKQGILFADKDLSALYNSLRSAITLGGEDGAFLRSIGLTSNFSDGQTTLTLDEDKFRAALESNPDQVKDAFVKTAGNGSSTDGFMQTMKNTLERYAKTTGATKGILIEKAGSPLSSASLLKNVFQDQLDNLDKQIDKWTTKMSDQVDRYTTQFSRLEQLIAQMNSQSSMLAGLMGGAG